MSELLFLYKCCIVTCGKDPSISEASSEFPAAECNRHRHVALTLATPASMVRVRKNASTVPIGALFKNTLQLIITTALVGVIVYYGAQITNWWLSGGVMLLWFLVMSQYAYGWSFKKTR